jgi:NHL repeat-containing protein
MIRPSTRGLARRRTLAAALVTATILGGFSIQTARADAPLVFEPAADALVKSGSRSTNFGTSSTIQADNSPLIESYLRFSVSGAGPVARATLQLFAVDGSQNGPVLYPSATSWTETGITWNNRPARTGPAAGNLTRVNTGWVEYDVTSLITGDGTYSFALVADSSDGADFSSRDAAGNHPRLVIELAGPDTTPPHTTITGGPNGTVPQTTATFTFASTEAGSSFSCSLDGADFAACSSPASFTDLVDGIHTFKVFATDPIGNTEDPPAIRTWTVDTTAPPPIPPAQGIIRTVAGTGTAGGGGDGGPALLGQLREPRTLAVDALGNVYVADTYNHSIRKIDTQGVITTVAGTGNPGYSGDGGPATAAKLETPHSVALDADGILYIADSPNQRIRKVDHAGIITTIAGTGASGFSGDGGPATKAKLNYPKGIEIGADGLLYIADSLNQRIRRVDASGVITTIAGNGTAGFSGDGGPATAAKLNRPRNVVFDAAGQLWIADDLNYRVRKVSAAGVITTYAGTGVAGFSGDGGPATAAKFSQVRDIALDRAGNLFVADELNSRIRRIVPGGTVTTYAGTGVNGFSGDGGPATSAKLYHPRGVAIGPDGLLVLADTFNHRIRKVS